MTLILAVVATLPLVLVPALLGSTGTTTRALARISKRPAPDAGPMFAPLRRALSDLVSSGVPKDKIERLAAAELRLITRGAK